MEAVSESLQTLDTLLRDVQNSENSRTVRTLLDSSLRFLLAPGIPEQPELYESQLAELAGKATFQSLGSARFKGLCQSVLVLYRGALTQGNDTAVLKRQLMTADLSLSDPNGIAALILAVWNQRSESIASYLLRQTVGTRKLVDMDWSFGVTASGDDCDHIGKTYLQLRLTLEGSGEEQDGKNSRQKLFLELSLEQFYQFLASLEKAQSYLDLVAPR